MKIAAFFDLDGTLISVNSGRLWMQSELKAKRISLLNFAESLVYMVGYRFGLVDMEHAMQRAMKMIEGKEVEVLRQRTYEWFKKDVQKYASKEAFKVIQEHRQQGHILVLLTSSSKYESEAATAFFGLDDYLCTLYGVKDGRFDGTFLKPLCYGDGKVYYAKKWAEEHDVVLKESYFYTDSITDLPMLLEVGHPRVVNPDPRLKRVAKRNNWPVLKWY